MRNAFMNTIIQSCGNREDIFIITGDAGLGVLDEFKQAFPDRFLNLGVAEQNMISFSAGLAMTGFKVVIYNIIPFLLYRCYEQVRNDICYQHLPVILAGIGSGLSYAPQGMTHYSIEDIGVARTLPNLTIISPIDPIEAKRSAEYALSANSPVYVRLPKRGEPDIHPDTDFDILAPHVLAQGDRVAVIFHGSIGVEVSAARKMLAAEGIFPKIVSMPVLQPINEQALWEILKDVESAVTVEEHYSDCGLGAALSNFIMENGLQCRLKKLGIPGGFIHEVLDTKGMRKHFRIDADAIAENVRALYRAPSIHG